MLKNSKWRSRVIIHARITSEDDEYSDALEVAASAGASIIQSRGYRKKSQYKESDFMIWVERSHGLTILMSQYDIIMQIISMQSEIYLLNLYLSC